MEYAGTVLCGGTLVARVVIVDSGINKTRKVFNKSKVLFSMNQVKLYIQMKIMIHLVMGQLFPK